jgi:hypothetical protein
MLSTNASRWTRPHALICFSRWIAWFGPLHFSSYTNRVMLYL